MGNIDTRPQFIEYLLKRNPSEKNALIYVRYLAGAIVRAATEKIAGTRNIFEVTDTNTVEKIYQIVKCDSKNIKFHNVYSGAISAYNKFLIGKPLRARVVGLIENEQK